MATVSHESAWSRLRRVLGADPLWRGVDGDSNSMPFLRISEQAMERTDRMGNDETQHMHGHGLSLFFRLLRKKRDSSARTFSTRIQRSSHSDARFTNG